MKIVTSGVRIDFIMRVLDFVFSWTLVLQDNQDKKNILLVEWRIYTITTT